MERCSGYASVVGVVQRDLQPKFVWQAVMDEDLVRPERPGPQCDGDVLGTLLGGRGIALSRPLLLLMGRDGRLALSRAGPFALFHSLGICWRQVFKRASNVFKACKTLRRPAALS